MKTEKILRTPGGFIQKTTAMFMSVATLLFMTGIYLFFPNFAYAAVGFDNTTSNFRAAGGASATVITAHTSAAGSTVVMLCATFNDSNQNANQTVSLTASSGSAPVKLATADSGATKNTRAEIWYQLSPTTGSSVNYTITYNNINYVGLSVSSFSGTDTAAPSITVTNTGTAASISDSVTTTVNNSFVFDCLSNEAQATVGGTQTKVGETTNQSFQWGAASYTTNAVTPAGSKSMTWTLGSNWAHAVSVIAAPPGAGVTHAAEYIGKAAIYQKNGAVYSN